MDFQVYFRNSGDLGLRLYLGSNMHSSKSIVTENGQKYLTTCNIMLANSRQFFENYGQKIPRVLKIDGPGKPGYSNIVSNYFM